MLYPKVVRILAVVNGKGALTKMAEVAMTLAILTKFNCF